MTILITCEKDLQDKILKLISDYTRVIQGQVKHEVQSVPQNLVSTGILKELIHDYEALDLKSKENAELRVIKNAMDILTNAVRSVK